MNWNYVQILILMLLDGSMFSRMKNVWGNSWELNGFQFGITAGESREFEDEVVARKYSRIPLYYDWHPEFEDYYGFSLAWKKYKSDSDLSIDFYTT